MPYNYSQITKKKCNLMYAQNLVPKLQNVPKNFSILRDAKSLKGTSRPLYNVIMPHNLETKVK